ncbi:MAG: hypothetical protein HN509_02605 [Halobacteriovoraceae bacterium]|nr:hypothetical protein [Halobacteriovoraceae bacterium]MBT5094039.1 hypothetical protein [Halobacteriovoraceae bacterium]
MTLRSRLFNFVLKIFSLLPSALTLLPYLLLASLTRFLIKQKQLQIWLRNSLKEKNIVPGLSDLDFTLYLAGPLMKQENKRIVKRYNLIHKFFPLLGEINFYQADEVTLFSSLANPLELKRDPDLLEKISTPVRDQTLQSDLVFIIHILFSDFDNLKKRFSLRRKKWQRHLERLSIPLSLESIHSIEDLLELFDRELFDKVSRNEFKRFLIRYQQFNFKAANSMNRFYEGVIHVKSFILLAPSKWIGASLDSGEFEMDCELIRNFSELEQKIYVEQINWEIWGLFSQYRVTMEELDLHIHLGNLKKTLDCIKDVDTSSLQEKMDQLVSLQEKYYRQ